MNPEASLLTLAAYVLIVIGVAGSILPILPGPVLIWLGAILWSWVDGFQRVGWPTLVILGILTVLAYASDLVLSTYGSRRAGASWKAVGGAIVGAIVGAVVLTGVLPVIGTILGSILGAVVGMLIIEYLDKGDWRQSMRACRGYIFGSMAAIALQLFLSLLMVAIFAWQALG